MQYVKNVIFVTANEQGNALSCINPAARTNLRQQELKFFAPPAVNKAKGLYLGFSRAQRLSSKKGRFFELKFFGLTFLTRKVSAIYLTQRDSLTMIREILEEVKNHLKESSNNPTRGAGLTRPILLAVLVGISIFFAKRK